MDARQAAENVIRTLQQNGREAFLVGGCVRDIVLGRPPKDFDVATKARPEEVQAIFPRTLPVGEKFGVVIVMVEGHQIEVATYRRDGVYTDGRRPDEVSYSNNVQEDVKRRDFTMNGLLLTSSSDFSVKGVPGDHIYKFGAYSVLDYVSGLEDIRNKTIRCIGDPATRFTEDALRMMRAVRFAAQLNFSIEQQTLKAIVNLREKIQQISRERVTMELLRLLTAPYPVVGLVPLFHSGLARFVFTPDFVSELKLGHTLERFEVCQPHDPILALTMLLTDASPRVADQVLGNLRLSSAQYNKVHEALMIGRFGVLHYHNVAYKEPAHLKRTARLTGFDIALQILEQDSAIGKCLHSPAYVAEVLASYRSLTPEEINPAPLITGQDLIDMGKTPGPEFSEILRRVETEQLNGKLPSREAALQFVVLGGA